MAEDGENTGAEASAAGVDPAAMALALGGASRTKADAFLEDQRKLIADQRHHLNIQLKRLKMGVISDRLTMALKVLTGFVGIAVAAGFGLMVWNAAHANGLLIEPFLVPADLAARGISGQAVAARLLDTLTDMDSNSGYRATKSYANNWGDDIKVEIPETGVSFSEAYRLLRGWLGHDTHISGEVYRTATGIAITIRASGQPGQTVAGAESDLDAVVEKAAEQIYSRTQLYRFAGYLRTHLRLDEAQVIYNRLTDDANPPERAWAWIGLSTLESRKDDVRKSLADGLRAVEADPNSTMGYYWLGPTQSILSLAEAELATRRQGDKLLSRDQVPDIQPQMIDSMRLWNREQIANLLGDFAEVVRLGRSSDNLPVIDLNISREDYRLDVVTALAHQHDGFGARAAIDRLPAATPGTDIFRAMILKVGASYVMDSDMGNWQGIAATQSEVEKAVVTFTGSTRAARIHRTLPPWFALARAHLGDAAGAEAAIAGTAADCYDCLRVRARIAEVGKQAGRADYWFARAVQLAPSIPCAYADWGQALLARGDADGAIAKFTFACQKGPHFADPLEGWGEALMAKKDSGAAAKFEEAEKYAPNWGRLHLKWGEALAYAGKKDEARLQYLKASSLDLSDADKAELARQMPG